MKQKLIELLEHNIISSPVASNGGLPAEPVRLLYGRGGRAPDFRDINIDFYPPLIFITLYRDYTEEEIGMMTEAVRTVFGAVPLIVQDRAVRPAVIRACGGDIPDELIISENGLKFCLHPRRGQNPGFFIDMRLCRLYVRDFVSELCARGGHPVCVLNLFAYTCAFSVAAAASGAGKIVNIDKNRRSLDIGKKNHSLNSAVIPGGDRRQALFLPHDIFKSMGRLKKEGPYDLIIADPPPSQKGSFMMLSDYPKLLRRLPDMLKPGGRIMITHNGPGWDWSEFEDMVSGSLPAGFILRRIEPPEDFSSAEPGRGLKILIAELKI